MDKSSVKVIQSVSRAIQILRCFDDKEELLEYVNKVRENGYAEDFEELEEGLTCVAAPIINHTGKAVAAISVSGPTSRMNKEFRQKIIVTLVEVTKEISKKLGYFNI